MARVCMILEGTYPYSVGGVSSWVQAIISGIPELEFSVVHLYFEKEPDRMKFALPKNLKEVIKLPLLIDERHADFDKVLSQIPEADIYHSLSTGFAGLVGAELKRRFYKPFMLTEHGIYWHEIEIGADEIEFGFKLMKMDRRSLILGGTWLNWLQFFKKIARKTYASADLLTTVCEWNRRKQVSVSRYGRKSRVINNGVQLPPANLSKKYLNQSSPTIGLVGRVTPIKDIETYIRACDRVRCSFPDARFYVVGPIENDAEYYLKCKNLATELGLGKLYFTGQINAHHFYPKLDLVTLTSVSEGQPFALLEAMAAGVPVVATDVGGCGEIINGNNDGVGPSGMLCSVGDWENIAASMIQILRNESLWSEFSQNGRKRVEKLYSLTTMIEKYRKAYYSLI